MKLHSMVPYNEQRCSVVWNFPKWHRCHGNQKKCQNFEKFCPYRFSQMVSPKFIKLHSMVPYNVQRCSVVWNFSKWLPLPWKPEKCENSNKFCPHRFLRIGGLKFMKLHSMVPYTVQRCSVVWNFSKWHRYHGNQKKVKMQKIIIFWEILMQS